METLKTNMLPNRADLAQIVRYALASRFDARNVLALAVLALPPFIYLRCLLQGSGDADPWLGTTTSRGSCLSEVGATTRVVVFE